MTAGQEPIQVQYIEVYTFTGDREPVVETWETRGGTPKSRVHQAPVFHFDHMRTV